MDKRFISQCPFCGGGLSVSRLSCGHCHTNIESVLPVPPFFRLPPDLQEFVLTFLRCEGKISEVEKALDISYPTVCKRLELVNVLLGNQSSTLDANKILEQLQRGEISVRAATQLLKER